MHSMVKVLLLIPVLYSLQKGLNEFTIDFAINNPVIMVTNGLGDHPLYELVSVTHYGTE